MASVSQNNPYTKEAYFGVAHSGLPQSAHQKCNNRVVPPRPYLQGVCSKTQVDVVALDSTEPVLRYVFSYTYILMIK